MDLHAITADLERVHGIRASAAGASAVGGGCIHRVLRLETEGGPLLLKVNALDQLDVLQAEAEGLEALGDAGGVRVPDVLALGAAGEQAYLALEWLELHGKPPTAERRLAAGLARQHRSTSKRFGWHRDNTIGATPQPNSPTADWIAFVRDSRIGFQLELAVRNGLPPRCRESGARLLARLESFFDGYRPAPSLLHGDLWGGNWGATRDGVPCVFDPAVYFGDREADLAMTRLFGGFGPAFYRAYESEWPLADGWERRVDLYNLYHLLNHFNLFGGGYRAQVESAIERLSRAT